MKYRECETCGCTIPADKPCHCDNWESCPDDVKEEEEEE